ncbi:hypothetical protein [Clostridium sporogenes]|uniref:hypothetical protein n=1 Tax=Clostridium sporogenes TaxID=1509 RepID=UPI0013D5CA40|nr:hypothetical protein [Clostridium sporogenes]NFH40823.1 hypothetical protein [Clostridium sporogenes]
MNLLDEIIQGIAKEYEKEKNKDQNYYGDELPSSIKKIWSDVDDILAKNNNITIKEKEKDMLLFSKNNKINTDRVTTDSIAKGCDKVKAVIDNRKDLSKGDIVKIIDGEYKGLSDKNCRFLDFVESMDKVLIQTDKFNRLYVNPDDIELVKGYKEKYKATTFNKIEDKYENITVEIEDDILTITLQDGTKSKKALKGENRAKIMKISYYDAKIKQYLKESKELTNIK